MLKTTRKFVIFLLICDIRTETAVENLHVGIFGVDMECLLSIAHALGFNKFYSSIQIDPELLKQAAEVELDAGQHRFILLTEEELEEYIINHGGNTQ